MQPNDVESSAAARDSVGSTTQTASSDRAVAHARRVYGQLGPQRTALLVGGAAVLIGAVLPIAQMDSYLSVASHVTLLNGGFAGFLALAIGIVLAVLPIWRPNLERRTDLFAALAGAFCLGAILVVNGAFSYVSDLTHGTLGAGPGMLFLIAGYLILTYVYVRRAFTLQNLWGS
jgi:hypothetical protein